MNTAATPMINFRYLIIGIAMLVAAGLALAITPREKIADQGPKVNLETMIPKQFEDWQIDEKIVPLQINPVLKANLDKIYNQILSRTYINSQGRSIMLSIAYGDDQRDGMNVHYPEVCYPAQGFRAKGGSQAQITTPHGIINAQHLEMVMGTRNEPITYWTMVGEHQAGKGLKKKMAEMRYSLKGIIPDGMLVRVSSISHDSEQAYRDHEAFIQAMLGALRPQTRLRLSGLHG